jgi:hypothetical protein
MTAKEFMTNIERTFGAYQNPGMQDVVKIHIRKLSEESLNNLYIELLRTHDAYYPPTLAGLLKREREIGNQISSVPLLIDAGPTNEERLQIAKMVRDLLDDLAERKKVCKEDID